MARKKRLQLGNRADRDSITEIMRQGMQSEFWLMIMQALDESMKILQAEADSDEMKTLPPEQYKLESELIKAKRYYLARLKEYPQVIINRVADTNFEDFEFDPYEKN